MASGMRYAYNIQPQVYQGGKDTILPYFVDDEAGGMFSHKIITIIPLYWQLQFLVSSRVVTAAVLPLGAPPRDLPLGAKPFPDHAPPL